MRAHYNLSLLFRKACSEGRRPLTAAPGRPCVSDSRRKSCLASTAAYIRRVYIPFKDLISRRGWIKIRTSSFVESKCIIVRFRAMAGPPVERRELVRAVAAAFERATDALSFNRDLSTWKLPSRRPVLSGLWSLLSGFHVREMRRGG